MDKDGPAQTPKPYPDPKPPAVSVSGLPPRLRGSLQHPLTRYPLAIGSLASVIVAFSHATIFLDVFAVGGIAIGLVSFALNYVFRGASYVQKQAEIAGVAAWEAGLRELKHALSKLQYEAGLEKPAEQAVEQLSQAERKFRAFERLLSEKLSPSELTYGRYETAAQQVYLAVLDNLRSLSGRLQAAASTDAEYARAHGQTDRLALRDQQLAAAAETLAANERALTELDRVSAAIAALVTRHGLASADLGTLVGELEELAGRARKYSVQ
jgi:hypothetical protein